MIKVAVLWILNEQNETLLAQRALNKSQDPGVWGPAVTGKLELGESFDEALVREVEEELSLKPTDYTPRFLFERDYNHPDGEVRKFGTYVARIPKAKTVDIQIDPNEVAGIQWFGVDELLEKMASVPNELVPSANSVWPETFKAIWPNMMGGG
ncbi:MAG TPA: NUDIX domain-containing protein [Candidatus Saccharimonadia bacterium]|nr:NUDIX domain-containing protein [Candidatus Saccharimonadia bacterium]